MINFDICFRLMCMVYAEFLNYIWDKCKEPAKNVNFAKVYIQKRILLIFFNTLIIFLNGWSSH